GAVMRRQGRDREVWSGGSLSHRYAMTHRNRIRGALGEVRPRTWPKPRSRKSLSRRSGVAVSKAFRLIPGGPTRWWEVSRGRSTPLGGRAELGRMDFRRGFLA